MVLKLVRDPSNRHGGWALIRLPGSASGQTHVVISREEGEFTLGAHGWQGGVHQFGPYTVEHDEKSPFVRIGPEIVDHMEEYLMVKVELGELDLSEDLSWPDQIRPSPAASDGGGVGIDPVRPVEAESPTRPVRREPPEPLTDPAENEAVQAPDAQTEILPLRHSVEEPPEPAETQAGEDPKKKSNLWLLLLLLLLVAVVVPVGYFMLFHEDEPVVVQEQRNSEIAGDGSDEQVEPVRDPDNEQLSDLPARCDEESISAFLSAPARDSEDLHRVALLCADAGNTDLRLRLLGLLIDREDPAALLQWAKWYDPSRAVQGDPFTPDASTAATFYKRAAAAGSEEAANALTEFCAGLETSTNPLGDIYRSMHCQ